MENFIQLKKSSVLKIGIKTADGVDTGEHLEFDMEDVELPLRLNECEAQHRKNINDLKMKTLLIDKKEDKKGKKLLSWKEEEKIKIFKEFYDKEMESLDLFLGKGGTAKLLNGRNPYYSMYEDISEMLKPILPLLQKSTDDIINKVKEKYANVKDDVLQ